MAPTVCDNDIEPFGNQNRILRQRSVINYVGRETNRGNPLRDELDASENGRCFQRNLELLRSSAENRAIIKRHRHEHDFSSESDDSLDSTPNPMTFHNYAKRRKFSQSDDDTDKYTSSSSDSNENSISSTFSSFNDGLDREYTNSCRVLHKYSSNVHHPLAAISPVSSTTGGVSVYHRFSKMPLRSMNPFYQNDLIEIAMKTIVLLQKNRSLHARLHQLKLETRAFVNSVMSNPENAKLRETFGAPNDIIVDTKK